MRTELLELLDVIKTIELEGGYDAGELRWVRGGRKNAHALWQLQQTTKSIRAKLDLQEKGEREAADELVAHTKAEEEATWQVEEAQSALCGGSD